MFIKSFIAAATLLSLAGAASAVTSIVITATPGTPNQYAGSFSGSAASNTFSLDLTGYGMVTVITSLLTANSLLGNGYNITGATFDGAPFTAELNVTNSKGSRDSWIFESVTGVAAGLHTLTVTGLALGGSFGGSIAVTASPIAPPPIPEPGTYALMLAGLGAVGFVAARRRPRA